MTRISPYSVALVLAFTCLVGACRFDDSTLSTKVACTTDDDCSFGVCEQRVCVRGGGQSDSDAGGDDTFEPCTPNQCGGCLPLDDVPGDTCGACGVVVCDGTEATSCDDRGRNACGGCALLGSTPGSSCDTCAAWTCEPGGEALTCVRNSTNACGGCGTLVAQPNASCGTCGNGRTACDGSEAVVCQGDRVDVCGGCVGPFDVRAGDSCGCGTATLGDRPIYECDGTAPACRDGNETALAGYILGTVNDDSGAISRRGSLQFNGDEDWYRLVINDPGGFADLAGAEPRVTMTGAASGDLICLFWEYSDGRDWRLACGSGNRFGTEEDADVDGCCSAPATGATLTAQIGNADIFGGSLDPGGTDASGVLHIVVANENESLTCHDYSFRIDL